MGRPIPVADKAVAQAALTALFEPMDDAGEIADVVIEAASRVRFQPSTRQLVITLDLAMGDKSDTE